MKKILSIGLLVLALSATGICEAEIPDLGGNWAGTGPGYNEEAGYVEEADYGTVTYNITEQNGRVFNGEMTYQVDGADVVEGFAGAIGADNKTFYVTEFVSGYDVGTVISEDEIEVIYIQDGEQDSEAGEIFIQTLRRVVSAQGDGMGMGPQAGVHEPGTGLVESELKEEAQGTGQGLTEVEEMDAGEELVAFDLTGDWGADGTNFYIRQVNDTIWWFAEDSAEDPAWTSVAYGTVEDNTVSVTWVDVPKANATIMGTAVLNVTMEDELQLVDQTGGFGGEDCEQVVLIRINSGF